MFILELDDEYYGEALRCSCGSAIVEVEKGTPHRARGTMIVWVMYGVDEASGMDARAEGGLCFSVLSIDKRLLLSNGHIRE